MMKRNSFKISKVVRKPLLMALFVLLTAFVISSLVINAATPTGTRLKNIQSRVLIGTEFPSNFNSMSDSATFTSVGAAEFNLVTPENAMKWDATEHSQTPSWVQNLSASAMESAMNNHIDKVMAHFKGKVIYWDVVNEAFNEDGTYRNSFWYQKMGKAFIEKAFIRARQADNTCKLIYNDYNLEATGGKSNGAYNMLKDFKARGIPVDGIGFQMHLDIQYAFNYNDFASNMQRFADLGLEIYITEMDVRVSSSPSSAELQTQADYYKGVIQKCMAQPAVKAIQIWGFTDKYSWVPGTFPGRGAALIFDNNYNPKASYYSTQSAIGSPVTITPTRNTPTPTPTTRPGTPTPTPIPGTISIAAGRTSALGSFQADQYYSGGSTYANSNTIDVSQITSNPPPAALFNNERYGAMSYTIPGFTAGNSYTVTLYFAETYLTSSGSRRFNVSINGATVLSNFDIYATAGGQNKAIARSFTATANSSGQIVIQFTSVTENPKINGISIKPGGSNPTPTPTPTRGNTPTPTPTGRPTPSGVTYTPTPTPTPPPGSYVVTYTISDWGGAGNVDVIIKNNTANAVNGWTLAWTFPGTQKITNMWNASYTQSGASVSAKNLSYNNIITANGGTVSFGFSNTYTGSNTKPTSFTLNGAACQVQ
jgi:endo-1,4-beta-xylanase